MMVEITNINKYTSRFLSITALFFLFSLIAFNRMSRDYLAYEDAFVNLGFKEKLERGYVFLVDLVTKFGGDHSTIVFLAGLVFLLVFMRLNNSVRHINLVIFFYCCSVLVYDITQTRNFLMYLIVIMSLYYVIKRRPIKHYLVLFLATLFHKLAFIYAPFYFIATKIDKKKFEKIMIILVLVLFATSPLVIYLLKLIIPAKMDSYLPRKPGMGVLINYAHVILDIMTIWWVNKKINGKVDELEERKMTVFYRFAWIPILILPFSHYFLEVIRVERNAALIKFVFIALAMKYLTVRQRMFALILLGISAILFFVILDMTGQWDLVDYLDENYIKYAIEKNFSYLGF